MEDGFREFPDGQPLTITLEFFDFETPKGISMELVQGYWREIGIDLRLKLVDGSLQSARARGGEMQMTLWHADRVTDILFPLFPDWWLSRSISWDRCLWNDWARWYMTSGRLGEEPPALMKQLQEAHGRDATVDGPANPGGEGRFSACHRCGESLGHRDGRSRAAPGSRTKKTEGCASRGHLGLGQSLDAVVPPWDLVSRRRGRFARVRPGSDWHYQTGSDPDTD